MTFKRPDRPRREREDTFANHVPRARPIAGRRFDVLPELEEVPHIAKTTTAAEREYMGRVAAMGCVVCRLMGLGPTGAQVHHVRAGVGKAQRAGNFCTVPLCEPHHTGPRGVHGDKGCLRQLNMSELDLLDYVIGELASV
jgi:hypothetical protein